MVGTGRRHLVETGLSYGSHLRRASKVGGRLVVAGAACLVHGLIPALFSQKASRTIIRLHEEMKAAPAHGGAPMLLEFEI